MKRVLVTGGAGFIGQQTILPLLEQGYEVHITSRANQCLNKQVVTHHINLLDCDKHLALMKKVRPTHLLHSAWFTENGKFWETIDNVYWLKATISLAEAFYAAGGIRLVGVGTCAEYDWHDGLCTENKTPEMPLSLYGKAKKSTYDCLSALSQFYEKNFAWARIFFPYGVGEAEKRLIPHVITGLLRNQPVKCTHGNQIRDFLHVCDMGNALATILNAGISGPINVGSGIPVTIREVVNYISTTLNKAHLIQFGGIPEPINSPQKILADVNRLTTELNWRAKFSLKDGLSRTISWWENMEKTEHAQ